LKQEVILINYTFSFFAVPSFLCWKMLEFWNTCSKQTEYWWAAVCFHFWTWFWILVLPIFIEIWARLFSQMLLQACVEVQN